MSLNSKISERRKFIQRLHSIGNNIPLRGNKNKTFFNFDKNVNSFISSKNYDILKYQKLPYFRRKKNYFKYNNKRVEETPLSFDLRNNEEKKKLIKEINRSFNELKLQDKEMKKYKDFFSTIKEQNKNNQYIINQIINEEKETKEENTKIDNNEKNNENKPNNDIIITALNSGKKKDEPLSDSKDNKIDPLSNRDTDKIEKLDFFLTKTILPTKNNLFSKTSRGNIIKNNNLLSPKSKGSKNYLKNITKKKRSSQINFLKRELIYYNKEIDKDNQKLETFKKKEKISKYIKAQNELELQNKELEDLIKLYNEYQKKIKEFSSVIYFYKIKNEYYISSINEIKNRINKNYNPSKDDWEQDIPKMESDKKAFEGNISSYKFENDKIKKEIEELKKKEKSLIEFIRNNLNVLNEKNKSSVEINNSYALEIKLKKKLELKNTKLEKAKKFNSELNEYIKKSDFNKKNKFEEKTKYEQTEHEQIKKIKKEIDDINQEIQKYNYQNDVEENEMEIEINSNNDFLNEQKNEIEQLNKDEEYINNIIDQLNNELEILKNNVNNKNEELQELVKSIEGLKNK